MRTLLSGVFILLGVVLMPFSGLAAGLTTDHWSIDVSETSDMRLNFAVEYLGDNAVTEAPGAEAAAVDESAQTPPATVVMTPPPPTDTVPTIVPATPGDLLINEFVSDPMIGSSEWIELYNTLPIALNLDGWSVQDAAGTSVSVTGTVNAHDYLLVAISRSLLNNGGDVITLLGADGTIIDRVSYGETEMPSSVHGPAVNDPSSVGRSPEDPVLLIEMNPTPGAQNVLPQTFEMSTVSAPVIESTTTDETEDASTDVSEPATDETENPTYDLTANHDSENCQPTETSASVDSADGTPTQVVPIGNIRALELGAQLITEGVVSAAPGILGKQVFYLAGSGIQVYLHSAEFPELPRGMRVRVTGILSSSAGEARLKLADASDIERLGQEDAPLPHDLSLQEISEATEGWLVRVTGTVASKDGNAYVLSNGDNEAKMYLKESTNIVPTFSVGDELTVVGIVSETSAGYRILPRGNDDILVRTPQNEEEQEVIPAGFISSKQTPTKLIGWSLAGAVAVALSALGITHALKHKEMLVTTT